MNHRLALWLLLLIIVAIVAFWYLGTLKSDVPMIEGTAPAVEQEMTEEAEPETEMEIDTEARTAAPAPSSPDQSSAPASSGNGDAEVEAALEAFTDIENESYDDSNVEQDFSGNIELES